MELGEFVSARKSRSKRFAKVWHPSCSPSSNPIEETFFDHAVRSERSVLSRILDDIPAEPRRSRARALAY